MRHFLIPFLCILLSCNERSPRDKKMYRDSVQKADSVAFADSILTAQVAKMMAENKVDTSVTYDTSVYSQIIPAHILRFVSQNMSGWELLPPDKWEKYWFNKYKTDSSLVNFAEGDFNCDGNEDYAMLLLKEPEDRLGLWVFSDLMSGTKIQMVDSLEEASPMQYGISSIDENEIEDMYDVKPVHPSCQCIDFVKFESASRTYYYENGEYKYVQTSD